MLNPTLRTSPFDFPEFASGRFVGSSPCSVNSAERDDPSHQELSKYRAHKQMTSQPTSEDLPQIRSSEDREKDFT